MRTIFKAVLVSLLVPLVALAQSAFDPQASTPSWIATEDRSMSIGTAGDGDLNFFANDTLFWHIDAATGNLVPDGAGVLLVGGLTSSGDVVLKTDADAQRLLTFGASSDVLLTLKYGDAGTTAVQFLTISASTADADDDSTLILAGGGAYASDGTRGAGIVIPGEEVSGGSDILYNAGAGDTHIFSVAGTAELTIAAGGLTIVSGDVNLPAGGTIAIQEGTGASACSGTATCNGATDVTVTTSCATTGSRVFLQRTSADTDGVGQTYIKTAPNNTAFVVNCVTANDTSTFNWVIFHEAP